MKMRLRVRLYCWIELWTSRIIRLAGAIHEGFWLGCLDAEDLGDIAVHWFGKSKWYNSPEHNLSGFYAWEQEMISKYYRPNSRILVAAAGGGRELIALHRAGFRADGFECTPNLVETSRRALKDFDIPSEVFLCPPNEVPTGLPMYDGLIIGWGAYMLIPGSARRISFLRKLHQMGPPGAPILLSFFVKSGKSRAEALAFRIARTVRFFRGKVKEPLEYGDHLREDGYHHCFDRTELEAELKAGGFRMCHFSDVEYGHALAVSE